MKTLETITMPKGFYLITRYNGRTMAREWYKTKTALNTRVKALKAEGFTAA